MSKKTTMTDIAKALGVSQTLVSFVLSGKNDMGISADTKKKVLQTAEKMGYCTGTASKMLKLGRCGYMAVLFADTPSKGLADILSGVCEGLSEFGYSPVITDPVKGTDVSRCLAMVRDKKADGFIIFGRDDKLGSELSKAGAVFTVLNEEVFEDARKCAVKLCEDVLACAEDTKNRSETRKKRTSGGAVRKTSKAVVEDKVEDTKPAAPEIKAEKKESIWLL